MAIQQDLQKLKNVAVKRFRIYDRIAPNMRPGDADYAWSERGICDADDGHDDFRNVQDDVYRKFIRKIDEIIINRLSMGFLISPASIL
ncbi:hypothetical protein DPMN_140150 [Dreissena polymorpha]|uniref:Uncharacterized protein n=1 Tax=Dreissena polymorpha TaxID=45954 RepID=A0A9D4G735_DREPO|nr:hypothetical protein DPMN_140150 [Dreissena polymorpha]